MPSKDVENTTLNLWEDSKQILRYFKNVKDKVCVCAITISKWLQNCIVHTYKNENYQRKVKGHEVRKSSALYTWTMDLN